ncbi:MAG TPA: CheR family methyltransferase [Polyangia bacterium]|jgi:chemotaxis protein methyltransferase CheR|nr:CheR family methyltransferase [Polyangia bacterium]
MKSPLELDDVERFRALIVQRLGLQFDDGKLDLLAQILRQRLDATGGDGGGRYLQALEGGASDELGALAEQLTVGETYFFRNLDQLRACTELCLGERQRALAGRRPLRILSAGCASGEEAYSLAIMTREQLADPVQIVAIDLNPAAIAKAKRGRYSDWSLRETPEPMRERYFRGHGRDQELAADIRALVHFDVRNLVDESPDFWRAESFDVVFCRNVLMYFSPRQARAVIARIERALTPGGYLFLGHAETLRDLSHDFHLRHTHATFYYQTFSLDERCNPAPSPAGVAAPGASWVDAIATAHARIATLTAGAPRANAAPAPVGAGAWPPATTAAPSATLPLAARATPLAAAMELLRHERFADALALVRALPTFDRADSDAQLLHAVLLMHSGDLPAAQAACRGLLLADELNAGARYLMALLCEQLGELAEAREHDLAAAYLDPRFAMPRLHLGLLARRAGERARAHDELGRALELLAREETARILLFGGGFNREALMDLCRAELRRTEPRS